MSFKCSFNLLLSCLHFMCPFIHFFSTHTHSHTTPLITISSRAHYCFSSVLITSGLDPRFSQRAAEGDGVYANVCVWAECWGLAGWRGHCCCQSIVTPDSPKHHSIIQGGKHSGKMRAADQTVADVLCESLISSNSPEIPDPNMPGEEIWATGKISFDARNNLLVCDPAHFSCLPSVPPVLVPHVSLLCVFGQKKIDGLEIRKAHIWGPVALTQCICVNECVLFWVMCVDYQ